MPQYMLSVHAVAGEVGEPMTDEEQQEAYRQIAELNQELRDVGAWVFSGRLADPDLATVVSRSGGELLTTDGPFVESKEHLAGFYVLEVPDLDAALHWAARTTAIVGAPIEVRPLWDGSGA